MGLCGCLNLFGWRNVTDDSVLRETEGSMGSLDLKALRERKVKG